MKTVLATIAALGLGVSAAAACPMMKNAKSDYMTTASIKAPMSTAEQAIKGTGEEAEMTGGAAQDTVKEEPAE